ncbi:hypothetical protein DL766_006248 [Monosporascus sp. MC13-8B]|uniref:Clr5 domain-containing protein n=1 Tax=Monosporascus cannonballus TaxID=155416 RepID=A0ABY0GW25_9PEZI|nr:hypothetical protein DL762_008792 [Monosporascus cannonballus]RYO91814.1 hypothetical protein DL763_004867 [Monosporascus cannonballus]RYP27699.1 hypothetical protein DL766_006248 [Monosporascus sp. MC13-8B]
MSSMSAHGEWDLHKNTIHRLYIVEDRLLKEVMATLTEQGFRQTKTRFEQQLKTWGFSKNLQSDEWKAICRKAGKRKLENKASDVVASGIRYPQAKVRKEASRHFYNTQEKLQHVPQETANEQDKLLLLVTGTHGFSNLDSSSCNVSTVAAELGKLMLESFEGEHFLSSHLILKERGIISASTLLRILAYRFSNNLIETGGTGVLDFIRRSGVLDPDILTEDLILAQPTLGAFFEKIFEQAIESRQIGIVMKALDLGKDPSAVLRDPTLTCQLSAVVVEMLLLAGAKVHMEPAPSHSRECPSLLVELIEKRKRLRKEDLTKLVRLFISKGFPIKQHCCERHGNALQVAVRTGSVALVRDMIFLAVGDPDVVKAHDMVQYLLSRYSSESDEAKLRLGPPLDLNILLEATRLGNEAIVRLCQASGVDRNGEDELGRYPLALAALKSYEMCKLLLQLGAWPDKTPGNFEPNYVPTTLHFAAISGNFAATVFYRRKETCRALYKPDYYQ